MSACFFGLGFLCYFIALVVWVTERAGAATQHQAARQGTGGARVGLPPVRAAYRRETAGVRVGPDRAGASPQASGGEMPA
ncbi:MAG: hypothetical protein HY023_17625, partial [Chloroflexi bacterium]|nr:hypothetical protein [Chloroflexota bacterium]